MFRITLLVTAIFAFTCSASAQQRREGGRISREQLAEKQAKYIAEELRLSTDETEKFIPTLNVREKSGLWVRAKPENRIGL